jgi:hypothetical protein
MNRIMSARWHITMQKIFDFTSFFFLNAIKYFSDICPGAEAEKSFFPAPIKSFGSLRLRLYNTDIRTGSYVDPDPYKFPGSGSGIRSWVSRLQNLL